MSIINIQILVDAAAIVAKALPAGSETNPTGLGSWSQSDVYISMTTQSGNVNNNEGQSELEVNANSGDTIEWSINTFDNNADNTVYLYNGTFNSQTQGIPASQAISPLVYLSVKVNNYLPPSGNVTGTPTLYQNQVAFAQATLLQPGVVLQYTLSFIVINNTTGSIVGYYSWDPFINVIG
ncbi:AidA/PixA family protein [Mucilaginibacter polytrichastri]|uniref:Inclusion body protein n=1 Tax=Mucilaginibacter polytrichastri TaxID=1302689 RepID=A0A1Q6A1C5_9SPHI|nr:AidA/PixA family protein [Mucilaginibacter polytrichastri]OKS87814.1 hypothetical protein RG47T_3277 [Mucilaginibacter polytrichastri]SFT25898.1 Inclusion body protein [Mucilaginibacter polytrichastri]